MAKKSKKKKKQPEKTNKSTSVEPPPNRRWLFLSVAVVFAIALVWGFGGQFANGRARANLNEREYDTAQWWLDVGQSFPFQRGDNEMLFARLERKRGKTRKMFEHLERAKDAGVSQITIEREKWLAYAQGGQMQNGQENLAKLLMDPRDDGAEIFEAYAYGYLLTHQFNFAQDMIDQWAKYYPDDPQPHFLSGYLWRDLRNLTYAEEELREAIKRKSDHYQSHLGLAQVLVGNKNPEDALTHFKIAEVDESLRAEARAGQANCHRILGNTDEARKILGALLSKDPKHPMANLVMARVEMATGDYKEAYERLMPMVKNDPRDLDLRSEYASALRAMGKMDESSEQREFVSTARKKMDEAAEFARQVLKDPKDVDSRYEAGKIYLKYSSENEGLAWLNSVFNYDENHQAAHVELARYYESKDPITPDDRRIARHHRKKAREALTATKHDGENEPPEFPK